MKGIQIANEKSIAKEERRAGRITQEDHSRKKKAGSDLLFHLFMRINYAKMQNRDIIHLSISYE